MTTQPITVVSPVHLLRRTLACWDAEKVEGAYGVSPCPSPLLPLPPPFLLAQPDSPCIVCTKLFSTSFATSGIASNLMGWWLEVDGHSAIAGDSRSTATYLLPPLYSPLALLSPRLLLILCYRWIPPPSPTSGPLRGSTLASPRAKPASPAESWQACSTFSDD